VKLTSLLPRGKLEQGLLLVFALCSFAPLAAIAILAYRSEDLAPSPYIQIGLPMVILLVFCLAALLSVLRIRRRLAPLEVLVEGSLRIAANRLDTHIDVRTNDEFAELAIALNGMSERLHAQSKSLDTTLEIGRAIASSLDIRSVVNTLLSRISEVHPCDVAAIALIQQRVSDSLKIYLNRAESLQSEGLDLTGFTEAQAHQLCANRDLLVFDAGENNPHYLEPLSDMAIEMMLVLPLFANQELIGVLVLGHRDRRKCNEAAIAYARQISDHAASALRNARVIEENRVLSYYDVLTGLPNRRLFCDRLQQTIIHAQRKKSMVAVGTLDLDGFKRVNDTLGHRAGDRLLCQVAETLAASVRVTDAVARVDFTVTDVGLSRFGSNEFTFVLTEISNPQDAARVARRIQKALSKPFFVEGKEVVTSASMGIAIYPIDGEDVEDIMKNVGIALSCAKSRGRGSYQFFAPSMNIEASRKLHLESRLWRALDRDELVLHYQPVRDVASSEIVGAEALVRWRDSEMGLVSPGEFIPVAEETGVIIPIGAWVLRRACEQLHQWQVDGFRPIRLSVNLSSHQLADPALVELVRRTLEEYGISPAQLELEVTETAIMRGDEVSLASLRGLDELGVGLVLDDFGTGYSSLSHLRRFPFARLKIDRSFVKEIPANPDDVVLTQAIIAMAHSLRMAVVAEGVETREQADLLREQGCDEFQGFLFSRPVPPEQFIRFLESEKLSEASAQIILSDRPEGRSRRSR